MTDENKDLTSTLKPNQDSSSNSELDSRMFFKKYWKFILPIPILTILIALNQLRLSHFDTLNPWKGGGYGMFTTISQRFFHFHLLDDKTFNCVEKPLYLSFEQQKLANFPTYERMSFLAKNFSSKKWFFKNKFVYGKKELSIEMVNKNNEDLWSPEGNVIFSKFEILVYDVKFNPHTLSLSPVLIKDLSITKELN